MTMTTAATWFNPLPLYTDSGARAGAASRQHDAALVAHETHWLRRAVALEASHCPAAAAAARDAWRAAYRAAAAAR